MAGLGDGRVSMSREEHHLLADLFAHAAGFVLRDDLTFVAERRLAPRLEALGLSTFMAYYRYLRFDARGPEELEVAIDLLVPHETYFFREAAQLACFRDEVCPLLEKENAGSKRLRVWSAGCATGEEAYTVAMVLEDTGRFDGWDCEVLGTDLSHKSLNTARHAEYGPGSFRAASLEQKEAHFEEAEHGRLRVKQRTRECVRFGRLNLLDAGGARLLPRMDVIFCRNVLIYLDDKARAKVVDIFFDRLRDGGYLLLGHSENLFSMGTRFELVHLSGDLVYRRPQP